MTKQARKKRIVAIIRRCEADIKVTECQYKHDLNHWAAEFAAVHKWQRETEAHLTAQDGKEKTLKDQLDSLMFIELNGNGKKSPTPLVLRDIWHATESIRANDRFKNDFKNWRNTASIGKFSKSIIGKLIIVITIVWITTSSLHTLGLESINPWEIIKNIASAVWNYFVHGH